MSRATAATGSSARRVTEAVLRLLVAGGLAYSAYVHWHLHRSYDGNRTSLLSQGDVFVVQAVVAVVVAILVLAAWFPPLRSRTLNLLIAGLALAVSAGSLGAVLVYRYVDVGRIGALPNMYEPAWYGDKTHSAWAEAVATLAAAGLLLLLFLQPKAGDSDGARVLTADSSAVLPGRHHANH